MPFDNYLAAGVHIGMKQRTTDMSRFVFKIRDDGLSVLDVSQIDHRIKLIGKFLSGVKKIMVVSRKSASQESIMKFSEAVDGKVILGRFLPGTITNPSFRGYYEPDVLIVTDPVIDKQALTEAVKTRIPIIALCDSFNETTNVDIVLPCNNKGRKSLGAVYGALAEEILKGRGLSEEEAKEKTSEIYVEVKKIVREAPRTEEVEESIEPVEESEDTPEEDSEDEAEEVEEEKSEEPEVVEEDEPLEETADESSEEEKTEE